MLQQHKFKQLPEIPSGLSMPAHPAIQKEITENRVKLPGEGAELRKYLFYQVLFEILEKEGGEVSWSEYDDYRFTHTDCSIRFAMRTTDHIHTPHKNKAGSPVSKNPDRLFLVFEVLNPSVYGIKTEWHESTFKDIFTKLPEIHVSLLTIMAVMHKEKRVRDEEAAKRQAEQREREELERQQQIAEDIRKVEEAEKKRRAELREQEHHKMLAFISIAQHWKALDTAKEFLSYLVGRVESVGDGSSNDALMAMVAHLEAAFAKEEEAFGNIQGIMDFVENAKPPQQKSHQEPPGSNDNQRISHPEYYEHSEPYAHIPPWKRYSWFRKKY
ncbi:MAG: hypothetical protein LUE17_14315 [Planctomycetaceae bacterium]|nr:hypothetical protein [Planctomycetaceae bacterium]